MPKQLIFASLAFRAKKRPMRCEVFLDEMEAVVPWAEQHDVDGLVDEAQREQLLDVDAVDARWPLSVEVGNRIEGADR